MMSELLHKTGIVLLELMLLAVAVLSLFSWIGHEMGMEGITNVLSYAGIRWMLRNTIDNFACFPISQIIILAISVGSVFRSGILSLLRSCLLMHERITVREKAGLQICLLMLALFIALLLAGLLSSNAILLSITGSLSNSPLTMGWEVILGAYLTVSSLIFGLVSGHLRSNVDIFDALTYGISRSSGLFVILLMASILWQTVIYIFY